MIKVRTITLNLNKVFQIYREFTIKVDQIIVFSNTPFNSVGEVTTLSL